VNLRQLLWPDVPDELWNDWHWQLENRLRGLKGLEFLADTLNVNLAGAQRVLTKYKWASTPYYLGLIDADNFLADPIARQAIPAEEEVTFRLTDSFEDPLEERTYSPVKGLIHRYRDRVVLLASGRCASYCRHCNRKRTWNAPECLALTPNSLQKVKNYLASNPVVREVIISGGDPLLLPEEALRKLLELLTSIPNIEVLRIGTRVPVVLPMRITPRLCSLLRKFRPIWINTHFNHPAELTPKTIEALDQLTSAGLPVSNQTVLLRGVNDDYETLATLFCHLHAALVRPYYLFQCDHVRGTDHFRTSLDTGIKIIEKMWGNIGGMCIPNLVADLPGGNGKARLLPSHLLDGEDEWAIFRTFENKLVKVKFDLL